MTDFNDRVADAVDGSASPIGGVLGAVRGFDAQLACGAGGGLGRVGGMVAAARFEVRASILCIQTQCSGMCAVLFTGECNRFDGFSTACLVLQR